MEDRYTVPGLLRTQAAAQPDASMLMCRDQRRSWGEVYRVSAQVAQALASEGVGPDDRVAFLDRNGLAYFEVLFGGSLAGAVNVAVNWRLAPVEMGAVIDDSASSVLIVHADYLDALAAMESGLPKVRRVVVLGDPRDRVDRGGASDQARQVGYRDWVGDRPAVDPGHQPGAREVSMQLYTSGTTGLPKGVMLSNANLATAIGDAGRTFSIAPDTVSLVAMPLFHIGGSGWALCAMSRGGRSVILRDMDPVALLALVESERITEAFVVPAVLMMLLATPEIRSTDLSSLRNVFYGASPIGEDVLARCLEAFGCSFTQVYGMTETTGAITALPPEDHDPGGPRHHLLRSAGRAHPGVELRIVSSESGTDAAPGEVGELWTRSAYNMLGYWGKPDETAQVLDDQGWLRSGDAGVLDDEGYLYLRDRIKDMIVTGGENVYPVEIENVLLGHPGVADAAVIGIPDDRWGEAILAVVVPAPGPEPTSSEDLSSHCRGRLANYKVPKSFEFTDYLPRNPSGKVLKRELRAPYWVGRDRAIH